MKHVYPQFPRVHETRAVSPNALRATDSLLATPHNTAHSCIRHGVAAACLRSERPESLHLFQKH